MSSEKGLAEEEAKRDVRQRESQVAVLAEATEDPLGWMVVHVECWKPPWSGGALSGARQLVEKADLGSVSAIQ